jgi:multidrug efflux system membrane fusion protein
MSLGEGVGNTFFRIANDPMKKPLNKRILITGAAILAAGLIYILLGGPLPWSGKPPLPPAAPVILQPVAMRRMQVIISNVGSVESPRNVTIKSRVDGQILTAAFKEGAHVRKGSLLYQLDPRSFEASLRMAEANLARDRAQLENAKANLKRYKELAARGFATGQQFDAAKSEAASLEATVAADKAAVDLAKLQLDYTNIRAPFDGVAGAELINPGNNVKANDLPLVVVNQVQPIYVTFSVPEQYLPQIRQNFKKHPLAVTVTLPDSEGPPLKGELIFVDNAIDATTGTLKLKAKFANLDGRLLPGQFVNTDLAVALIEKAVVIPTQALQTGQRGNYVYVAGKDMTAEIRNVISGISADGFTVVSAGLKLGEMIVIDGQMRLAPGMTVAPTATPAAAPKAPRAN